MNTLKQYAKKLQTELNNADRLPTFEIEVTDKKGKKDYVTCDIYFKGSEIIALRIAVDTKEEESETVALTSSDVDDCFSLDEHLQELYSKVIEDIASGDLFELAF